MEHDGGEPGGHDEKEGRIAFRTEDDTLVLVLAGTWKIGEAIPEVDEVLARLLAGKLKGIAFESHLEHWDSSLLAFLVKLRTAVAAQEIAFHEDGLPHGIRRLLALANTTTAPPPQNATGRHSGLLARIGHRTVVLLTAAAATLAFLGQFVLALMRFATGRARFQRSDLVMFLRQAGAEALPIVSLISLLVGLITAFVGSIQLRMLGAQLFVADIVGISMVRVMGAVMTGVIIAGRTGAAYAAQLGTMQVNEETDALRTLGVPVMEFLVLPRVVALAFMMPLLSIYADMMGILGGMIVGIFVLDLDALQYLRQTEHSIRPVFIWIGLLHALVFGILIGMSSCLRGMQAGRSASDVGVAATSAVVTSIVCMVLATAVITYVCQVFGI